MNQSIPSSTTSMDSQGLSVESVPDTETPPPGYMSEDGDPMDQNDNLSESVSINWKKCPFIYFFAIGCYS